MKAIVFAAGIGSRLRPFTDEHPKALAPIAGHPALGIVIDKLVAAGADTVIVNVHHFAQQVIDFVNSQNYPVRIGFSDETDLLLDTGGGIVKIWRESGLDSILSDDEPLVVHNADILTDFPVDDIVGASCGSDAALLVDKDRHSSRKFLFDDNNRLRGWINKSTGAVRPDGINPAVLTEAAFGGVHVLYRHILDDISTYCGDLHPFSITDYYIDRCSEMSIRGYTPARAYKWFDIGTPERLEAAQSFMS